MVNHLRNTSNVDTDVTLYNRKKYLLGTLVRFRDVIQWFSVENLGSYLYKESYEYFTPFRQVDITHRSRTARLDNIEIARLMRKTGSISKEKIANLKVQLKFIL